MTRFSAYRVPLVFLAGIAAGVGVAWSLRPATAADSAAAAENAQRHSPRRELESSGEAPKNQRLSAIGGTVSGNDLLAGAKPGKVNGKLINALEKALHDPSEARRARKFSELLESMRPEDALAVLDLLTRMEVEGVHVPAELKAFWPRWGEIDGKSAMVYQDDQIKQGKANRWTGEAMLASIGSWALEDPEAARAYAESIGEPRKSFFAISIAKGMAAKDIDTATAFALASDKDRPGLANAAMEEISRTALNTKGLPGLLDWFHTLPDEKAKTAAFEHVLWRQFEADPIAAKKLIAANPNLSWNKPKIMDEIVVGLVKINPVEAITWAGDQTDVAADKDYGNVQLGMSEWFDQGKGPTPADLARYQNQPWYNNAAFAAVRHLQDHKLPGAEAWLATMSGELGQAARAYRPRE
jgi:hypothetical protein